MNRPESHYKKEGEYYLVEIKLREVRQLFNSFDPAPFREKDLEASAENYIVDSVQEFRLETPIKIVLHLPPDACTAEASSGVPEAIHNYFSYRADISAKEFRLMLMQGRVAMIIGLVFLGVCLAAQQIIASLGKTDLVWRIIQEGFLISGWVAMWKPVDIFLYEWWPVRRKRRIYEKLARVPVELRALP
jgi:hypothetical protein